MIRDTWDLESIAARYVTFDKRWTPQLGTGSGDDPIGTRLRLVSEWLWTIRTDQTARPAGSMARELLEAAPLR
jgi:phenylacetic acid degradation operon negative regulatory protein